MRLKRFCFSKISEKAVIALPAIGAIGGGIIEGVRGSKKTKKSLVSEKKDALDASDSYLKYLENSGASNEDIDSAKYINQKAKYEHSEAENLSDKEYRSKNIKKGIKKGVMDGSGYGFLAALPLSYRLIKK